MTIRVAHIFEEVIRDRAPTIAAHLEQWPHVASSRVWFARTKRYDAALCGAVLFLGEARERVFVCPLATQLPPRAAQNKEKTIDLLAGRLAVVEANAERLLMEVNLRKPVADKRRRKRIA